MTFREKRSGSPPALLSSELLSSACQEPKKQVIYKLPNTRTDRALNARTDRALDAGADRALDAGADRALDAGADRALDAGADRALASGPRPDKLTRVANRALESVSVGTRTSSTKTNDELAAR